jgi:ribosomal RNA-processing protein 12
LFRNFPGTQPSTSTANTDMDNKKKVKKPNRGFKTAADGRIIIKMDDRGGDDSDDSTAEIEGFADKAKKQVYDESDESGPEEEEADNGFGGSSRKRKAVEGSVKSGRSGATSKYTAGGKGIHRQVFYPIFSKFPLYFFILP